MESNITSLPPCGCKIELVQENMQKPLKEGSYTKFTNLI